MMRIFIYSLIWGAIGLFFIAEDLPALTEGKNHCLTPLIREEYTDRATDSPYIWPQLIRPGWVNEITDYIVLSGDFTGDFEVFSKKDGYFLWSIKYSYENEELVNYTMKYGDDPNVNLRLEEDTQTGGFKKRIIYNYSPQLRSVPANEHTAVLWGIDNRIYAFELATGEMLWSFVVEGIPAFKASAHQYLESGFEGSVKLFRNTIELFLYKPDKDGTFTVVAVDTKEQKTLWQQTGYWLAYSYDQQEAFIGKMGMSETSGIYCYDIQTGAMKWFYPVVSTFLSQCALSSEVVYCCSMKGKLVKNALYALNRETGELIWQYTSSKGDFHEPRFLSTSAQIVLLETESQWNTPIRYASYLWRVFDHKKTVSCIHE